MSRFKVHLVHVGNMNNKGTQALFKSDVYAIEDIVKGDVEFSVSTTDVEGVRQLNLGLKSVLPPVVDIPYERADQWAKRLGYSREDFRYKWSASAMLFYMFLQVLLSVLSVISVKLGLRAFYRAEVIDRVQKCDLVISHSDESFKETASLLPLNPYWVITWWSMLIARTWEILIAKSFRKPVILFPNSVGPFRTWIGRWLSKLSLGNCDCLLIRDPISYDIVDSLGIESQKILTLDTALLFNVPPGGLPDDFARPLLGVAPGIYSHSLSRREMENYVQAHAGALDAAIEKHGFSVVFLPHYVSGFQHDDLEVSQLILRNMKNANRARLINTSGVDEFKSYLDQMDMIISSKMHPAVLGASGGVPILCVAYDHKQTGFFERLGMADCTIGIRQVSFERLSSKINHVWEQRDRLKALLSEQIPRFQRDIKEAMMHAMGRFLHGSSG